MHDQIYTIQQVANLLQASPSTLARWRVQGGGPNFLKVGRKVLYRAIDITDWLDRHSYNSTAQAGQSCPAQQARPANLGARA